MLVVLPTLDMPLSVISMQLTLLAPLLLLLLLLPLLPLHLLWPLLLFRPVVSPPSTPHLRVPQLLPQLLHCRQPRSISLQGDGKRRGSGASTVMRWQVPHRKQKGAGAASVRLRSRSRRTFTKEARMPGWMCR